ncbi:hypothetical protein ABIE44_000176 [Marmoricola sp. OAE513]|uniref:DUF3710 domain-containing protein n=1 Tax=Marmoricola sp. OAE513 TaxID=2817894 RepID=UPI001AE2E7DB
MRLRRKNTDPVVEPAGTPDASVVEPAETSADPAPAGPVDVEDLDPDTTYIDLGSMLVAPVDGLELRLQVDEDSGEVLAVLLVAEEGVLEMRAFANSRGGDLWDEARSEIAADTERRGGTATEREGSFGTELYCQVPVEGPEGESLVQPSRIVGYNGPRWFVRATMAGRPAMDAEYCAPFEQAIRSLAVRRGHEAMAPGEPLPLKLPPEARPQTEDEAATDAGLR